MKLVVKIWILVLIIVGIVMKSDSAKSNSINVPVCYVDQDGDGQINPSTEIFQCTSNYECPIPNVSCNLSTRECEITTYEIERVNQRTFDLEERVCIPTPIEDICFTKVFRRVKVTTNVINGVSYILITITDKEHRPLKSVTLIFTGNGLSDPYSENPNEVRNPISYTFNDIHTELKVTVHGTSYVEVWAKYKKEHKFCKTIEVWGASATFCTPKLTIATDGSTNLRIIEKKLGFACNEIWTCPVSEEHQCFDPRDPANQAIAQTVQPSYDHNGFVDGRCLGYVYIFNGKRFECRKEVPHSAFIVNCCKCKPELKNLLEEMLRGVRTIDYEELREAAASRIPIIGLTINVCNLDEALVACYRELGLCHKVGEYCANVVTVGGDQLFCAEPREVYCCFNSKLARILHEQGRKQLKTFGNTEEERWGRCGSCWTEAVEVPIIGWDLFNYWKCDSTTCEAKCRGFTPDEFQMLDFSEIDLREWYEDIEQRIEETTQNFQTQAENQIQQNAQNLQNTQ